MLFAFLFSYFSFAFANQLPREIQNEFDGSNDLENRYNDRNETLLIQKTKFSNFKVDDTVDGGAILVKGSLSNKVFTQGNCSIIDCEFLSCSARNGGAVYSSHSGDPNFVFSITSTKISQCQSSQNGGALYVKNSKSGIHFISVSDCTFDSNSAILGGAIYGDVRDELIINGCNFINNEASTRGSSLYLTLGGATPSNGEHGTYNITANSFVFSPKAGNTINVYIENKKITDTKKNSSVNVEISGCTFSISSSSIDQYYHLDITENQGNFESVIFNKCNCVSQGIETFNIPITLYPLTNINFECSSMDQCTPGGPIEAPSDPVKPPEEEDSVPPEGQYKEATRIDGITQNLLLIRNNFTELKSDTVEGGAIYIKVNKDNKCNATISDCKFNSCSSKNGGAIYSSYSGSYDFTFTVAISEFNGCEATENGGAIFMKNTQYEKHVFKVSGCTFTSNKAINGGGIYGYIRDQLVITGCKFENNEATKGSSLWLILGFNTTKLNEYDSFDITSNTFVFGPKAETDSNVYLENIKISNTTKDPPSTYVNIGGNTFSISNEFASPFYHLEINSVQTGFASINFNKCNCVQQGESTFNVPQTTIKNVNFGCTSINSCSTKPNIPPSTPDYETREERYDNTGAELIVKNTEFYKITSTSKGGAIFMEKKRANISLDHCKFTLCEASNGGAIYVSYASTDSTYIGTIKNTIFSYCSAKADGGAAYIGITQPKLHSFAFEGCTFESNDAGDQGGAIYGSVRDQFTVEQCNFLDNVAQNEGSSIYLVIGQSNKNENGNTITLTDNKFTFTPTKDSSNVYAKTATGTANNTNGNLIIGGCTFSTTDSSNAQAFKHLQVIESMKFESIRFSSCNCVHQGESSFSIPSSFTIENVHFGCTSIDSCTPENPDKPTDDTTPTEGDNDSHDRIDAPTQAVILNKVKFSNLKISESNGGAILIDGKDNKQNCSITDCEFTSCSADNGGAIYVSYSGTTNYFCSISKTKFIDCSATQNGGALYLKNTQYQHHSFTILKCTIKSNTAKLGGGIYGQIREQLTIKDCTFEDNEATNGSSLYLKLGQNDIKKGVDEQDYYNIIGNKFIFTPSSEKSNNVYIENIGIKNTTEDKPCANLIIGGCTFSSTNDFSPLKHLEIVSVSSGFSSITFSECNCVQQDESSFSVPSQYAVKNVHFGCTSIDSCDSRPNIPADTTNYETKTERYDQTGIEIKLSKVEFYKIVSDQNGGAIYMETGRANITLNDCKFTLCEASRGGAIFVQYATKNNTYVATIKNTIFLYCSAKGDGGAVCIEITQPKLHSFTFDGCTFESNSAGDQGGAIHGTIRDRLTIERCNFSNNVAGKEGSSIWMRIGYNSQSDKGNTVTLNDNTFTFTAKTESSNVYITTPPNSQGNTYKNANLNIGGCTFATTSNAQGFKHLEIFEQLQFESIKFTSCNCIQQDFSTISVPKVYTINNFHFNCDPNGQCTPGAVITPPPAEKPDEEGYTAHDRINDEGKSINQSFIKYTNINSNNENGGAILISTTKVNCRLVNCKFTDCSAQNGGAIYVSYTGGTNKYVCTITSTIFTSNTAKQNGGAIYLEITQSDRHSFSLYDCKFITNTAAQNGGAIYAKARDLVSIERCTFEYNNATLGSSIWLEVGWDHLNSGKTNDVNLISNTFSFTPFEGAVNVYAKTRKYLNQTLANAHLYLSLCKFSTTTNTDIKDFKHFVADEVDGPFSSINFPHCVLVKNGPSSVSLPQGYSTEGITFNADSLGSCKPDKEGFSIHERLEIEKPTDLKDFKFIYINSEKEGGAIVGKKVNFTLTHCKFESCKSDSFGGGVYVVYTGGDDYYACTITESQFIRCSAKNGGALYIQITQSDRHSATVTKCKFISNNAERNGGAVYADTRDRFTLTDSDFEDNLAPNNGSSLWCRLGWNDVYDNNLVTIQNNKFSFTPVDKYSINVFISAYTLNADVTPNANLVFGGCTFSATKNVNGFLHLKITHHRSQFESLTFPSCSCVEQGNKTVSLPVLYNPSYYFTFDCKDKCDAKPALPTPTPAPDAEGYTPALDRVNRVEFDPKVILTKVKFSNFAPPSNRYGGAIYSNNIPCTIYDCKFDSCQSTRGGAIYAYYYGTLGNYTCSIISSSFVNCNTSTNGGAIYVLIVQYQRHYVSIEGCTFNGNKATKNGGAIYAEVRDGLSVRQCTFTNNQAEEKGSSVWCRIGHDQPKDSEKGNYAVFYGNTFTFSPSETNKVNVYIQSNKLADEEHANANIRFDKNALNAANSQYNDYKLLEINEVGTFESFAISECNCIQGAESTVNITSKTEIDKTNLVFNCQNFEQCPSVETKNPETNDQCQSYPSRIESLKNEIEHEKACFNDLVAPELREGGAIRSINANVELKNCRFTKCTSGQNGGAIYVSYTGSECELEIEGCTFISCYSDSKGGAIYYYNTNPKCESTFENIRFEENSAAKGAGAFYYSPCANSIIKKCFFVNNTCLNKNSQGSSLYVFVANEAQNALSTKGKRAIKDDEVKPVVIEENRFRSEPAANAQQCYINLKKTGQLQFNTNSFSFNNAKEIPTNSRYIVLSKDEGAVFNVKDDICVDNSESLISGIDPSINVTTNCSNADAIFDDVTNREPENNGGKKNKTGMIVGIVVAVVVVIAVVIVVVVVVLKKKSANKYISDLNEEGIADNTTNANTEGNL